MPLRIRPVLDRDVESLVDLTLLAFVPIFESFPKILGDSIFRRIWPDWRAAQAEAVRSMCLKREQYTILVAEVEGDPAGYLIYELDAETRTGTILLIAVHPERQCHGIGTELCRVATGEMRERGMTLARVETAGDASHAPARRAYEKAGYTGLPLVRYFKSLET
jgi:ribosomal protein S18 acetylase RimI-like enzyme